MAGPRRYAPRMAPEQRREQLLDAALAIIAQEGPGVVSMKAVAERAGVTRPVVYDLFDDLSALLNALIDREEQRALAQLATLIPTIPGDRDPDDLLADGMRIWLEAVLAAPDRWRLILVPAAGARDFLRDRIERDRQRLLEHLQSVFEWGIRRRGGPQGLDEELFARMFVASGEEAARLVLSDPEHYAPERFARHTRALLAALARDQPPQDVPPPQPLQTLAAE
jgi:AcrR family transcriptional regulator